MFQPVLSRLPDLHPPDEHTVLIILTLGSLAVAVQSALICHRDLEEPWFDGHPGRCEGWTAWALACGGGSFLLALGLVLLAQVMPGLLLGSKLKWFELALLPWWIVGVGTMTFHSPYYLASNAYFGAWISLACCWLLAVRHFKHMQNLHDSVSSPIGICLVASIVGAVQTAILMDGPFKGIFKFEINTDEGQQVGAGSETTATFTRERITDRYALQNIDHARRDSIISDDDIKVMVLTCNCVSVFLCFCYSISPFKYSTIPTALGLLLFTMCTFAVLVSTFDHPYLYAGNGYFAAWIAWTQTSRMLPECMVQCCIKGLDTSELLVLIVPSVVVVMASSRLCAVYSCDSYTIWAANCGAISTVLASLLAITTNKTNTQYVVFGTLLSMVWLFGVGTMTFHLPFKMMGNGFAASWFSLIWACTIVKLHAEDSNCYADLMRCGRLARKEWQMTLQLCASCVLMAQAGVDCSERGSCEINWLRAIMIGAGGLVLAVVSCMFDNTIGLTKVVKVWAALSCAWWSLGVGVLTFASPYVLMGTAYTSIWVAFVASCCLLHKEYRACLGLQIQEFKASYDESPDAEQEAIQIEGEYEGHFSHPQMGPGNIDVKVVIKTPKDGDSTWMGDTYTISVSRFHRRVQVVTDSRTSTVFDGILDLKGAIRGEVSRGGVGGGNFVLLPKANSLYASLMDSSGRVIVSEDVNTEVITDRAIIDKLQELFDKTWQDRSYSGQHKVTKLKVERVVAVQNPKFKKQYFEKLQAIKAEHDSGEHKVVHEKLLSHSVDVSLLAPDIDLSVNEALMFHATAAGVGELILKSRVRVMANAAHGELYGPGCYFADTVSKADTYALPSSDGRCPMIISRVVIGNIFKATEDDPAINMLMRKINSREYHTICGDRRQYKRFGGWKEFIMYDEQRSLPLYLVWYTRGS